MDIPPKYFDEGDSSKWPIEKRSHKRKDTNTDQDEGSRHATSARGEHLMLEAALHNRPGTSMELVPVGVRSPEPRGQPNSVNVSKRIPDRDSAPYLRPQATLESPLDIDLDTYHQRFIQTNPDDSGNNRGSRDPIIASTAVALVKPGMSRDEQLAFVLSKHPDMDFDEVVKLLDSAEMQIQHQRTPYPGGSQSVQRGNTSIHMRSRTPVISNSSLGEDLYFRPDARNQQSDEILAPPQISILPRIQTPAIAPAIENTRAAALHSNQANAAEQEEEDFQLALLLSQQDSDYKNSANKPVASSGLSSNFQVPNALQVAGPVASGTLGTLPSWPSMHTQNNSPLESPNSSPSGEQSGFLPQNILRDSMNSSINNALTVPDTVRYERTLHQNDLPSRPLPLFPDNTALFQTSRFSSSAGPLVNRSAEQQAISDSVAIHSLHAQRQADRVLAESNLVNELQSQPRQNRAAQAAIALAKEDLADSRLETHLTNLQLSNRRVQDLRRHADEDELARLQRQQEAELRRRQSLQQSALRQQEASERTRARERRYQSELDARREQEDADAQFALELERMQHEQVLEKVDAISRVANQPRRRPHLPSASHTLEFSSSDTADGSLRDIRYDEAGGGCDANCRGRTRCGCRSRGY